MSTFHLFPQLPVELRLAIWRNCLPGRTSELDNPLDQIVFDLTLKPKALPPCQLQETTMLNGYPPIISRVCRESRAVAFETGHFAVSSEDKPADARWWSGNSLGYPWKDYARNSVHLNWSGAYAADFVSYGSPLHCLAWYGAQMRYGASLMISYFTDCPIPAPLLSQTVDALMQLPRWMVVMRVVVVHADFRTAAATGLFGLLGDALVQVVDVSDQARVNAFLNLGNKSEYHVVDGPDHKIRKNAFPWPLNTLNPPNKRECQIHVTEGLDRNSVESNEQTLRNVIIEAFGSEELLPRLRPAIMFRLCTRMCNHPGEVDYNFSASSAQSRGGGGRGHGRARRLARGRGRGG